MIALSPISLLAAFDSAPTLAAGAIAVPFTLGEEIEGAEMIEPETDEAEPPAGDDAPETGSRDEDVVPPWIPPLLLLAHEDEPVEVPAVQGAATDAPSAAEGVTVEALQVALPDLPAEAAPRDEEIPEYPMPEAPANTPDLASTETERDAAKTAEPPALPTIEALPPENAELPPPAAREAPTARQQAVSAAPDARPAEASRPAPATDAPTSEIPPDDLGDLQVTLEGEGETIHVTLSSESPETVQEMRRHAETLREDLAKQGFGQASLSFQQREGGRQQGHSGQGGAEAPATFNLTRPEAAASGLDLRL